MSYCPKCGVKVAEGANFCSNCGNELTESKGQLQARPHLGEKLEKEELERIAGAFVLDKTGGSDIRILSIRVGQGREHSIKGLAMMSYIGKEERQPSSLKGVFYGGYAEFHFRFKMMFDDELGFYKLVGPFKKEQRESLGLGSTVQGTPLESHECESHECETRECPSSPFSTTPLDLLNELKDRKLKDAKANTAKHGKGGRQDDIRRKFGF
jgi:hypothetical protein